MLKTWTQCSLSCWISSRHLLCQLNPLSYNNATLKWPFLLSLVPHPHHMVALFQDMDFGHLLSVKQLLPLCKPSRVHFFRPSDELHILKIPINPQFIFNNFWRLSWISKRIKLGILFCSEDEGKSQTSSQDLRMFDKTGMMKFLDMLEWMSCWSVHLFCCKSIYMTSAMGLQHDKLSSAVITVVLWLFNWFCIKGDWYPV